MSELVAIVTGTSSGLGKATAKLLAENGYKVYAGTLTPVEDEVLPGVTNYFLDVTKDSAVEDFVQYVLNEAGRIDALVNNAGYALAGALEEIPLDKAQELMDVNFFGAVRMCKACLPVMREQKSGHIVNITSGAGITAQPYAGFYSASKYALEGYSEALRHEVWQLGIKIALVEPGWMKTNVVENAVYVPNELDTYKERRQRVLDLVADYSATGMQPVEVANTVLSALQSKQPKARYRIGKDVVSSYWSRKFLPSRLYEHFVRSYYKLDY